MRERFAVGLLSGGPLHDQIVDGTNLYFAHTRPFLLSSDATLAPLRRVAIPLMG
jgi:hypothetical protein